jgi:hypothetical protein
MPASATVQQPVTVDAMVVERLVCARCCPVAKRQRLAIARTPRGLSSSPRDLSRPACFPALGHTQARNDG